MPEKENITDQFVSAISEVIQGWNEKLELTDEKLSLMVPFCDLYAVFKGDEKPEDAGTQRAIDSGFQVELVDFSGSESVTLVPVFNMLEQQLSVNPETGKLIRPRGVGGVTRLDVSTADINLGTYTINMEVEIPSFDVDVQINRAIRKLVIPGTDWIIAYGWARDAKGTFAPISDGKIDLRSPHYGYYRFLKSNLMKFDWEIATNRVVKGRLQFWPYHKSAGVIATWKVHRKTVKDLLSNPATLRQGCPSKIADKLPEQVSISRKREVKEKSGTERKKTVHEEDAYYYFGWVIEAMRQALEDPANPTFIKTVIFEDWNDPKKTNVMTNSDGKNEPTSTTIKNPAFIPISKSELESQIFDISTNETILWSIDSVCTLANKQMLGASELYVELNSDSTTLVIRDANDAAFNVANRADSMKVVASSPNSLIKSLELTSRVPTDLTWAFNYFINTDKGATVVYNMFEQEARSDKPDKEISETARIIRKFNKPATGNNAKALDANRSSNWREHLSVSSKDKIETITSEIVSSQSVPVGLALRNFFRSITIVIHGTAMVPPLTQLEIQGFLQGIDGRYQVFQASDTLSPGNFETSLEAIFLQ